MAEAILANVNQDKLKASLRFLDKQGEMTVETLKVNGQDVSKAEKLEELFKDEDFVKELAPTSNAAEAQAVFAAHGLELTPEEVKAISQQCAGCIKKLEENDGELSEEDLEQISGGAFSGNPDNLIAGFTAGGTAGLMPMANSTANYNGGVVNVGGIVVNCGNVSDPQGVAKAVEGTMEDFAQRLAAHNGGTVFV